MTEALMLAQLVRKLEELTALDDVVDRVSDLANSALPPGELKDALHGKHLGHALHPALVALPIGFTIAATLLDFCGDEQDRPAARRLVGAALLLTPPTAASVMADFSELGQSKRPKRVGLVHAGTNAAASVFFTGSWLARRAGRHRTGQALSLLGLTGLGLGGYLGGHLAYSQAVGVNRNADHTPEPSSWTDVAGIDELADGPIRVEVAGQPVMLAKADDGRTYAVGAVCSHLAGDLAEGELTGDCVVCPLHGSTFRLQDGGVVSGPATAAVPAYDVQTLGDRVTIRAQN